mmetsp:Transcript_3373/g.5194  ORF Transcript_3373/g.5194 Transcript_3373/m.5194 type:complete len:627 (-) Transcript_3373:79-1959(-)
MFHSKLLTLIAISLLSVIVVTRAEEDAVSFQQSAYVIPPPSPFLLHVRPTYSYSYHSDASSSLISPNSNSNGSDENENENENKNETINATNAIIQDSEFPCQPRKIHLSLGNRQKDSSLTGMHLSFSIPNYRLFTNTNANTNRCSPEHIRIEVKYGIGTAADNDNDVVHTKIIDVHSLNHNDGSTITRSGNTVVRQYDTTSPITLEHYSSDYIYHTALDGLKGDTLYWYTIQVFSNGNDTWMHSFDTSNWQSTSQSQEVKRYLRLGSMHPRSLGMANRQDQMFKTAPMPTKKGLARPVKFGIVGDLGQTYNSTVTMLNILSTIDNGDNGHDQHSHSTASVTPVTAVLIAGDMSYANSIQPQWDNWFTLMEPISHRVPIMVAAGNHEIECDADTYVPFLAYENRFYMPNRIQDADILPVEDHYRDSKWGCATPSQFIGTYDYGNAYYSFEYGLVKTIVLSSYSDTRKGSKQYNWLVEELESLDREETPWLVIMMHTQFYTTFKAHNDEEETVVMRGAMEELFLRYHVNLVFSGHDHAYMRSRPMFEGRVVENGQAPIYMIVGEGGNREEHVKDYLNENPEEWVEVRDKSVYGFGTLEVINATSAQWIWNMGGSHGFQDDVWMSNQYL